VACVSVYTSQTAGLDLGSFAQGRPKMSRSALSVDEHFIWMLCYVETLQKISHLVASSPDVPQFGHVAEFCARVVNIALDMGAHASAARAAIPPEVLLREAPWPRSNNLDATANQGENTHESGCSQHNAKNKRKAIAKATRGSREAGGTSRPGTAEMQRATGSESGDGRGVRGNHAEATRRNRRRRNKNGNRHD
jgi:hypothetical protein